MSARDELVDVLTMTRLSDFVPPDGLRLIEQAADAILAAGYRKPRTVTTVEELEALPVGSVTLRVVKDAFRRRAEAALRAAEEVSSE